MVASSRSNEQVMDTIKSKITDLFELKNKEINQLKSDHFIQDDSDSDDEDEFYIGQRVWFRDNSWPSRWPWDQGYVSNLNPLRVSHQHGGSEHGCSWDQVRLRLPKKKDDDLEGIHDYLRLIGRRFEKKEREVNRLKQEVHRLKQEVQAKIDLAEDQGINAMFLQSQKMILQELVTNAANHLITAKVPTHECADDKTPFYYMLESHRMDSKQTVPWNQTKNQPMTLVEGIEFIRNNRPLKRHRHT
tara:strand:- start:768 stop:1502 length:735 start_codon:yes stop_codon:yes gene_type:complete